MTSRETQAATQNRWAIGVCESDVARPEQSRVAAIALGSVTHRARTGLAEMGKGYAVTARCRRTSGVVSNNGRDSRRDGTIQAGNRLGGVDGMSGVRASGDTNAQKARQASAMTTYHPGAIPGPAIEP